MRAGIAVALLAGIGACVIAWREVEARLRRARKDSGDELRNTTQKLTAKLHQDRAASREVLDVVSSRNDQSRERIAELRRTIAELQTALSTERGNQATLKQRNVDLTEQNAELRQAIKAMQMELSALTDDDAEVLAMPRRAQVDPSAEPSEWDALPDPGTLWSESNFPTVVDLQKLSGGVLDEAPAVERKQA